MARHRVLGIGFGGVGLLEKRVDRVLGFSTATGPRWRKTALILGCAVAVVTSCSRGVPPLRDNPIHAERERKAKESAVIRSLSPKQVAELERTVAAKPDDLATRAKLLEFDAASGDYVLGKDKTVPARRAHILWLIANHPGHELAGSWGARIFPTDNDRDADPFGYAQAKALWLQTVKKPSVPTAVLANASTFFQVADKPLAEELLLRAQALEPDKKWSVRLGHLYYEVLMGSTASMPMGVIRSVNLADLGAHQNLTTCAPIELPTPGTAPWPVSRRWARHYHPRPRWAGGSLSVSIPG